jgi:hypothetical protein
MSRRSIKRVSGGSAFKQGIQNPPNPYTIVKDGPATPKQISYLVRCGVSPDIARQLTKLQASELIRNPARR